MNHRCVDIVINGQRYTKNQLFQYDYQRQLHVLHQMKRLGTHIEHGGVAMSHDAIDRLTHPKAREVSVLARQSYDTSGITALYANQLRASDRMWKDINAASGHAPLVPALVDIEITGLDRDISLSSVQSIAAMNREYTRLNPEHYSFSQKGDLVRVIETFGMYGGPTDSYVNVDLSVSVPIDPQPDYSVLTAGFNTLASDGTDINVRAFHQAKHLDDGVAVKLGAFFPAATPLQIVAGHQIHMALEFLYLVLPEAESSLNTQTRV